ncbi:MAG: hypothetical protein ACI8YB_000732 [Patiriisocius sp.]
MNPCYNKQMSDHDILPTSRERYSCSFLFLCWGNYEHYKIPTTLTLQKNL